ncbi:hypothetical protein [Roseibium sp.]|uniref:hypothetical protein n=1 Tax=Roseibium sp. TaxID=1936156 RepID=UPI003A96FCAF
MSRLRTALICLIVYVVSSSTAAAHGEHSKETLALGDFKIVNTGGFVEENGQRRPMAVDDAMGTVDLAISDDKSGMTLEINGSRIELFALENGLASFRWDADETNLLHQEDILDVSGKESLEQVHAWAAEIDWPDMGNVTMVLFNYSQKSYGGFLISKPEGRTIVRQMEFHRLTGPRHRADDVFSYNSPEHRR